MAGLFVVVNLLIAFSSVAALAQEFERDVIKTSGGDLEILFIGHGTLMFTLWGYGYRKGFGFAEKSE